MAILLANTLSKRTAVAAPPDRDMDAEYAQTLDAQMSAAPRQYDLYAEYAPKYDQVDLRRLQGSLFGGSFNADAYLNDRPDLLNNWNSDPEGYAKVYGTKEDYARADWGSNSGDTKYNSGTGWLDLNDQLTAYANKQSAASNTAQRQADLADVERFAPQVREQIKASNPELYANLSKLDAQAGVGIGSSDIQKALEQQARDELALGRKLSSEDIRMSQQASRAAFASRGLNSGNASIADEILNQQQVSDQRLAQRRAFAQSVDQVGYGQRVNEAEMGNRNTALAAQARQATFIDPYQGVLGRQSANVGTNQGIAGASFGITGQNSSIRGNFDPMNSYAQDLYNTNYNAKAAANISTANNKAGIYGGAMAADAQVGAAAMSSM
jgi:hypothetical protein